MMTNTDQEGQKPEIPSPQADATRGKLIIRDDVIAKIAKVTIEEVEGVCLGAGGGIMQAVVGATKGDNGDSQRGIRVRTGPGQAAFDLWLVADYGYSIPQVVSEVRQKLTERVQAMTGLKTTEINIDIVDINLPGKERRLETNNGS